jgi:rhodanese-related sulfurtransferase
MNQQSGAIPSISPREAAATLDAAADEASGPLLVDVREANEFEAQRAVGAALLPISQFMARYGELPKDRPLLMICQSGSRSASATMFLLQNGWTDVRNVEGGTQAWALAGLPTRTGRPDPGEGDLPQQ